MASVNANRSPIYILKADAIQPMAEAPCTSLSTCGARNKAITAEPKIILIMCCLPNNDLTLGWGLLFTPQEIRTRRPKQTGVYSYISSWASRHLMTSTQSAAVYEVNRRRKQRTPRSAVRSTICTEPWSGFRAVKHAWANPIPENDNSQRKLYRFEA